MTILGQAAPAVSFDTADMALLGLIAQLGREGYRFITSTPASHARVISRPDRRQAGSLRDILGWSLPFDPALPDHDILAALEAADMVETDPVSGLLRSRVRVSSLGSDLFLHSAYPTIAEDAVFFGPDSYRFAALIAQEIDDMVLPTGAHIVDIGTGAGVGALAASRRWSGARLTLTDINAQAVRFARLNAAAAGVDATTLLDCDLQAVDDPIDLALANPPYIIDADGRDYRDGGAMHGGAVALQMATMAVARLAPGGRLILYTGTAIVSGEDRLAAALGAIAKGSGCRMRYRELDPDVFGEELSDPAYADVERIAVVAAILEREA